jgi:hypothetical protein
MPAVDVSANLGLTQAAYDAAAVTPSDTLDLTTVTRWLYIGGAGNLAVVMFGTGTNLTLTGLLAGTLLPMRVSRVKATGTTATNILALW